jgi:hypothetical protein
MISVTYGIVVLIALIAGAAAAIKDARMAKLARKG